MLSEQLLPFGEGQGAKANWLLLFQDIITCSNNIERSLSGKWRFVGHVEQFRLSALTSAAPPPPSHARLLLKWPLKGRSRSLRL